MTHTIRCINIAFDNDITFIIKVCQKYLLASENYIVLLSFSWGFWWYILSICGCYIFKKKIVKKVLNNSENIKIWVEIVFSAGSLKRAVGFSNTNSHQPSFLTTNFLKWSI